MVPPIEDAGAILERAMVIVDRSGGTGTLTSPVSGRDHPVEALWTLDIPTYEAGPATCPACAAGEPIEVPGSSGTKATAFR